MLGSTSAGFPPAPMDCEETQQTIRLLLNSTKPRLHSPDLFPVGFGPSIVSEVLISIHTWKHLKGAETLQAGESQGIRGN